MRIAKLKNISLILIVVISFFLFFLGFNFSNPNNTEWLTTQDLISYQDAWNFLKMIVGDFHWAVYQIMGSILVIQ